MFTTAFKPLWFELIMIFSPLILQMMQAVYVGKHWLISLNLYSRYLCVFCNGVAGTHRNWCLHSHCLIDYIFQVIVLGQVQTLYWELFGQLFQSLGGISKWSKVLRKTISCFSFNFWMLNEVGNDVWNCICLCKCSSKEESKWFIDYLFIIIFKKWIF